MRRRLAENDDGGAATIALPRPSWRGRSCSEPMPVATQAVPGSAPPPEQAARLHEGLLAGSMLLKTTPTTPTPKANKTRLASSILSKPSVVSGRILCVLTRARLRESTERHRAERIESLLSSRKRERNCGVGRGFFFFFFFPRLRPKKKQKFTPFFSLHRLLFALVQQAIMVRLLS